MTSLRTDVLWGCEELRCFRWMNSGAVTLSGGAFTGCSKLYYLELGFERWNAQTSNLFAECSDKLEIEGKIGSDVHRYCIDEGIRFNGKDWCGDNVSYTIENGTLTLSGFGPTKDCNLTKAPWYKDREAITGISIGDGITRLGTHLFEYLGNVTSVSIPASVTEIGEHVFFGSGLTEVTIPSTVRELGFEAFGNCTDLTDVVIGNGITAIPGYCFKGCASLKNVSIPYSVKSIGSHAFAETEPLAVITIPVTVTYITDDAFADSTVAIIRGDSGSAAETFAASHSIAFERTVNYCGDGVTWIYTEGSSETVLLISGSGSMDDYPAGGAPWAAFADNCTMVAIGSGVTGIGSGAFARMQNLRTVRFSDPDAANQLRYIGDQAFMDCIRLRSLFDLSGITQIGKEAFSGCISLLSVRIPDTVTAIGSQAFGNCNDYFTIHGKPGTEAASYAAREGIRFVTEGTCGTDVSWKLEDGVLTIYGDGNMDDWDDDYPDWYAYRKSIRSVIIKQGVTSIGNYAFDWLSNLTSVSLPASLTSIGHYAFRGCSSLTSVTIPSGVLAIGQNAFLNCSSLTSVLIPATVTSFGANIFENTSASLVLYGKAGSSAQTYAADNDIVFSASGVCGDYCTWTLMDGVLTVSGSGPLPDFDSGYPSFYSARDSITGIVVEGDVTYIGNYAFFNLPAVTSVTIMDGVGKIGDKAFMDCGSLKSASIPSSVWSIGEDVFDGCSEDLVICCDGAANAAAARAASWGINYEASGSCGANCTYHIRDGILTVSGTGAMDDGYQDWAYATETITGIVVEEGVTHIGDNAFYSCGSAVSLTLPSTLESIGDYAFYRCGFTSVVIPYGIRSIGIGVFQNNNSLESIELPGSLETVGECAFEACSWSLTVCGSNRAAEHQADLSEAFFALCGSCGDSAKWHVADGTLYITGSGDIYDYTTSAPGWKACQDEYSSVIIGEGIESIGRAAFYGCDCITSVVIPSSVDTIKSYAFVGNSSLAALAIPNEVSYIKPSAIFAGSDSFVIRGIPGSAAETYADEAGIPFEAGGYCGDTVTWEVTDGVLTISGAGPTWDFADYYPGFYYCRDLYDCVVIGDGVTALGNCMFYDCDKIVSVSIPGRVTRIYSHAFYNCKGLTDVYYGGTEEAWADVDIGSNNAWLTAATLHCLSADSAPEVTNKTRSAGEGSASVTFESNGRIAVVSCDRACSLIARTGEGTYTRLTAIERADNEYMFDLAGISDGAELIVALRGDANMDGYINSSDLGQARAVMSQKLVPDALKMLIMDMRVDGLYNSTDLGQLRAVMSGKLSLAWN